MVENVDDVKSRVRYEINRIIRRELDDVETHIKNGNEAQALSELDDAVRKLKRLMKSL